LLDFGRIDGMYITHNNLAGLVTPSIGTENELSHNATELQRLVDSIGLKYECPPSGMIGSTQSIVSDRIPHIPFVPMHV
jgi:hypothetical protein